MLSRRSMESKMKSSGTDCGRMARSLIKIDEMGGKCRGNLPVSQAEFDACGLQQLPQITQLQAFVERPLVAGSKEETGRLVDAHQPLTKVVPVVRASCSLTLITVENASA
jgi:hypothetical protein